MTAAKTGDTIRMHYTGVLSNGQTFDSSAGRDPLEFTLGSGMIIPGLDKEIAGMAVGDTKKVTVTPAEGYGERDEQRIINVPRSELPEDLPTEIGTQLGMQTPDGQTLPVVITDVTDDAVTMDANHPLAGQELIFDIEIVEIREAA